MGKNRDKYLIICCFAFIIIFSSAFMYSEADSDDKEIIGVVTSISKNSNGFVFDLEDCSGTQYHCFTRSEIEKNTVYGISGSFSDDRSMFFVSELRLISQSEN